MSGHEARINDALKQLGEEYRLGMVAAEEYRSRRRLLLESWGERDVTTSPGSKSYGGPATAKMPKFVPAAAPPPAAKGSNPLVAVGVVALAVAIAATWFVMSHRAQPSAPNSMRSAAPALAPPSAEVAAIKKAADDFLARNNWDADAVEAFLQQWQALAAADRARALEEPSLRTLRHELGENLKTESQLVPADAPPEQRRRLDALTRFERELGGT